MADSLTSSLRHTSEKAEQRARDLAALEAMKKLEHKKRRSLKPLRLDERTITYATRGFIKEYKNLK